MIAETCDLRGSILLFQQASTWTQCCDDSDDNVAMIVVVIIVVISIAKQGFGEQSNAERVIRQIRPSSVCSITFPNIVHLIVSHQRLNLLILGASLLNTIVMGCSLAGENAICKWRRSPVWTAGALAVG